MSSQIEQTTQESVGVDSTLIQTSSQVTSSSRLFFADHLRVALTILVVLHHLAVIYGASALFYYLEPPKNDTLASLVLLAFVLINQAYFMGFFFLISGYFTPGSVDQKGSDSFFKDRLLRLGIPLVVFMLVLGPHRFHRTLLLDRHYDPVHPAIPQSYRGRPALVRRDAAALRLRLCDLAV